MARIRSLKIGFFKNEHLAELLAHDRLLFAGLWLLADRAGRLEDRPTRIRAELFPYETYDVDGGLERLETAGFVHRYTVEDGRYVQVVAFTKHQTPHPKEAQSQYPPPLTEKPRKDTAGRETPRKASGEPIGIFCSMGSGSMGSGSRDLASIGDQALVKIEDQRAVDLRARARSALFDQFWDCYPKHGGEADEAAAELVFAALKPTEDLVAKMIHTLGWKSQSSQWREDGGRFIPKAAKWLSQKGWQEEKPRIEPARSTNTKTSKTLEAARNVAKRLQGR
jgi:hypothetical protein